MQKSVVYSLIVAATLLCSCDQSNVSGPNPENAPLSAANIDSSKDGGARALAALAWKPYHVPGTWTLLSTRKSGVLDVAYNQDGYWVVPAKGPTKGHDGVYKVVNGKVSFTVFPKREPYEETTFIKIGASSYGVWAIDIKYHVWKLIGGFIWVRAPTRDGEFPTAMDIAVGSDEAWGVDLDRRHLWRCNGIRWQMAYLDAAPEDIIRIAVGKMIWVVTKTGNLYYVDLQRGGYVYQPVGGHKVRDVGIKEGGDNPWVVVSDEPRTGGFLIGQIFPDKQIVKYYDAGAMNIAVDGKDKPIVTNYRDAGFYVK